MRLTLGLGLGTICERVSGDETNVRIMSGNDMWKGECLGMRLTLG